MGVRHRAGVHASGDQAGEMRHIHHEHGVDFVGDGAEAGEIQLAWVRRPAGDDHFGPVCARCLGDGIHVDQVVLFGHLVGGGVVELAGKVDPHPVGQVTAMSQRQPQDGVAGV
ncbi:Uncharacterised protein [Mycobacterium tuberculosis]|uniref:Uncharacterized protein n=2 Tax=Mycobacterium tuberculosis TaxID=1773 RepID=A0A655AUM0_MYCTX|nr:Uncharacterised protein [Mycobacterium tuberculosis]CFE46415.1 Uncharacterised protein [Mycobacterium tuberculosis]CFS39998.1 Uncharacterised protein [Mycobacterium tuberculosis]CKR91517.1 Uncharacterised protein [Mycobacterium tuberculosis]CKT44415.1 Uncharacterised protein [Mycobacterium tuberculosis]